MVDNKLYVLLNAGVSQQQKREVICSANIPVAVNNAAKRHLTISTLVMLMETQFHKV